MKQLFGVAEDQTLEEKFTQNSQDAAKEDSLNEIDILLRQLKLLAS